MSQPVNETQSQPAAPLPPMRKPSFLKSALLGLGILLCGMVIGSALTAHIGHHFMLKAARDPNFLAEKMASRAMYGLHLTPDQERQVRAIVSSHVRQIRGQLGSVHPKVVEQMEQIHSEVRAVLTPEQQEKWDQHFAKMKSRFEERLPPP